MKRNYISFAFCLSICLHGVANQQLTDSLILLYQKAQHDTTKIDLLNELAWINRNSNPDLAINYSSQARTLSSNLNDSERLITSLNRLGLAIFYNNDFIQAKSIYQGILRLEGQKDEQTYGLGRASHQYSKILLELNELDSALIHANQAIKSFEITQSNAQLGNALINQGIILKKQGAYDASLNCFLKSLDLGNSTNNTSLKGYALQNLGNYYLAVDNLPKALSFLAQTARLFQHHDNPINLSNVFNDMGIAYFKLGNYDSARYYYQHSIDLLLQTGVEVDSKRLNNMGVLSMKMGELNAALNYFNASINSYRVASGGINFSESYINMGDIYYRQGKYSKAIQHYETALNSTEANKQLEYLIDIYNGLSLSYDALGKFKESLDYRNKFLDIKDQLINSFKASVKLQEDYIQEKNEKEILRRDKKIAEVEMDKIRAENQRQTTLIQFLTVAVILIIILFFLIFLFYRQKKQIQIAEKDTILAQQEKIDLINKQEKEYNYARLEGQDKERNRIAKDLHDRLGNTLTMVKIHYQSVLDDLEKLKVSSISSYNEAIGLIDQAREEVKKIAYNINSGVIAQFGLIAAIEDLVHTIEKRNLVKMDFDHFGIDDPLDREREVTLFRIIQELVMNVLKHAKANHIEIQFVLQEDNYNLSVSDDGIGFNLNNRTSPGMGLSNVAARAEQLGGSLHIDSNPGRGTFISIDFPQTNLSDD
ncbi:MAG: sensor histidine kinase [Cytophagales bacterium]|nr:sensor histidine kinase [Cytophagales bacterium]